MSARLIEPGSVLADRYLVEDLLVETGYADSWRAFDQVLARSVVLQILPSSSPYAGRLLTAAKSASQVTDPRILQVLDAVDDGELTYVVREWVNGQALEVLLAEGPLSARRAAWLMREVADAISSAHQLAVEHRRLAPASIVITKASGVKILGLGTAAALHDEEFRGDDPEYDDIVGLGRLLYACLTARWPGTGNTLLPTAPQAHGDYLRPRQVRAGVPRALDELCDRLLTRPSRFGEPVTSAAELKDELTSLLADDRPSGATAGFALTGSINPQSASDTDEPPALLPRQSGGPNPAPPSTGATVASKPRSSLPLKLIWTAVAVLVLGTMLLAYLIGQHGVQGPGPQPASPNSPAAPTVEPLHPITVAGATSFDPYPGSGDENPDLVPYAIDGDRTTAWETLTYDNNPALGGLKDGVGLVLDLGRVRDVRMVTVGLQGTGTSLELRAAPASASVAPANSANQYRLIQTKSDAGSSVVFRLDSPVATRYLLVWLTSLPPEGTNSYRGRVSEVKVLG